MYRWLALITCISIFVRFAVADITFLDCQILRLFSPALAQTDTLSSGQILAAFRLVVHVENGKDIDRGLVFTQGAFKFVPFKLFCQTLRHD